MARNPCTDFIPGPRKGGQLSDSDGREVVFGGFFEAPSDPELLESREAAFGQVALGVETLVQRVFSSAGVGDHRHSAFISDGIAQAIAVISGVGQDDVGG